MLQPWQGPITLESTQTGDGRVFAPGSVTWSDLPLPLAYLRDGDQHIDLTEMAPQIGTINTIETRPDGQVFGTGFIDDTIPDGAEVLRRMADNSAPLGTRFPVSIDGDNWTVQILVNNADLLEELLAEPEFSVSGNTVVHMRTGETLVRNMLRSTTAAAGDPDPGEPAEDDPALLYTDGADWILERYTSIRVRGATLCAVAAFDGAYIELAGEAVAAPAATAGAAPLTLVDPYPALPIPAAPPAAWFQVAEPEQGSDLLVEQEDGSWAVPLHITDDGQVFGHLARWTGAHRGYQTRVTPPRSNNAYADFSGGGGHVVTAEGTSIPTGPLCVGGDHAPLHMNMAQARDFYASSTLGFADGVVVDGQYGPWFCGSLRPGLNEADLRVLRALAPSGDWRANGGNLELICALMVNVPGFPVARETLAASAYATCGPGGCGIANQSPLPQVHVGDGVTALVAAGIVTKCAECAERSRQESLTASRSTEFERALLGFVRRTDAVLAQFTPGAMERLAARIRPAG